MGFTDALPNLSGAAGGAQTISLAFNAAGLAQGALRPVFRNSFGGMLGQPVTDTIQLDVTLVETHSAQAEVTQHPVEVGADISDHYRQKPREVRIQGIVTDTPIDGSLINAALRAAPGLGIALAGAESVSKAIFGQADVMRSTFDLMQRIRDTGTMLQVWTPYRVYQNMLMTDFEVTRDQKGGEALYFTATFREVFLVASSTATINLAPPIAQAPLDMGAQVTTPAPAKVTQSALSKLTGFGAPSPGSFIRARSP
jgi:hypothetical protein